MHVFVVTIFPSLLIIVLMKSSAVAEKLPLGDKNGNKGQTLCTKYNTKEDCGQDGKGIRRVLLITQFVSNNPNRQCYTQFFAGGQPPQGLRTGEANLQSIRYICQPPSPNQHNEHTYYATMFDENLGIAVFSAYKLTQNTALFSKKAPIRWCPTPGILSQGSHVLYRYQPNDPPYDRAHLVPERIYSSTQERHESTFTYTNAVPVTQYLNRGSWKMFEKRIRMFALQCTQPEHGDMAGTLYLLTGTAFSQVVVLPDEQIQIRPVQFQRLQGDDGHAVAIPRLLWTAGCCARQTTTRNFAVIGNNIQDGEHPENGNFVATRQVTVENLHQILLDDVTSNFNNVGGPNVNLFPGNGGCSDSHNVVHLPPYQKGG